jgi:hypothetical protein
MQGFGVILNVTREQRDNIVFFLLNGGRNLSQLKLKDESRIEEEGSIFFFFAILGFELKSYTLSHSNSVFCAGSF